MYQKELLIISGNHIRQQALDTRTQTTTIRMSSPAGRVHQPTNPDRSTSARRATPPFTIARTRVHMIKVSPAM